MRWLALALVLVGCGPKAPPPNPIPDYSDMTVDVPGVGEGATFACIYAASLDVRSGSIVVYWGDPPCVGDAPIKRWEAPIKWHCPVIQILALQLERESGTPEPIVVGKYCVQDDTIGG